MGTAVVRYQLQGEDIAHWGVQRQDNIYPLNNQAGTHRELMNLYFNDRAVFDAQTGATPIALSQARFKSPLASDIQLFCQGLNYADHRLEGGLAAEVSDDQNLIFTKAPSSICGPNDAIIRPAGCELLDYEIELGIVLRQSITAARTVAEEDLPSLIGALVLANDVSARDLQFGAPAMQWFKGKSQRTFCPMGPVLYLLDADDFEQLYQLRLELKLNGQVKQQASTDLLIHKPAATLSAISQFADLHAGDCVLTGTPGGVLLNMDVKTGLSVMLNLKNDAKRRAKFVAAQLARTAYLQPGDVLELAIASHDGSINLGQQKNKIVDAP